MSTRKQSLIEKYDIPISHLDFQYIKTCENAKELGRIIKILRSGEEGYFEELTKFAEDKLKEIKPNSKILRTEEALLTKSQLDSSDWKKINEALTEWSNEIRNKDKLISTLSDPTEYQNIPAIRKPFKKETSNKNVNQQGNNFKTGNKKSSSQRIKSTDYKQWDKYDPDTEILKMELEEEKIQEEVERKNRINIKKTEEFTRAALNLVNNEITAKLTDIEKENLSISHKDKGNEYFRVQEYEYAIVEYTKSINILPSISGYNNRAITYLKLDQYNNCIDDCNKCLEIEPKNIKALLRKAKAFLGLDKRHEALEIFTQIISIEPSNVTALNNLNTLRNELCCPPNNATRIKILESEIKSDPNKSTVAVNTTSKPKSPSTVKKDSITNKNVDNNSNIKDKNKTELKIKKAEMIEHKEDLSKLIIPNKIVKSKLVSAVQTLEQFKKQNKSNILKEKMKQPNKENDSEKFNIKLFDDNAPFISRKMSFVEEIKN